MDILDMILGAEMANEYTDSQRLAREEKTVITWDGNTEGKEKFSLPINDNIECYRVLSEPVDLHYVKRLTITIEGTNQKTDIDLSKSIIDSEGTISFLFADEGETLLVATCYEDFEVEGLTIKKGTYLAKFNNDHTAFVSCLELETVHQIDQKFIPNTVINLCDYGINAYEILMTGKTSCVFSVADTEELWKKIPTDYSPVTLITEDGTNFVTVDTSPFLSYAPDGSRVTSISSQAKLLNGSATIDYWLFLARDVDDSTTVYFEATIGAAPTETI